ncbi:hypothetical protein ABG768_003246, partial [Culter alburnus]
TRAGLQRHSSSSSGKRLQSWRRRDSIPPELPLTDVSLAAPDTALRKMLLSVPPRTGINPYNGYNSRNSKK